MVWSMFLVVLSIVVFFIVASDLIKFVQGEETSRLTIILALLMYLFVVVEVFIVGVSKLFI